MAQSGPLPRSVRSCLFQWGLLPQWDRWGRSVLSDLWGRSDRRSQMVLSDLSDQ